jgi:LuxR family maltose regulon positive regulatory protein
LLGRPELLARLDQAVHNHRLTLLNAPAGYGKTTLAVQWVNQTRFRTSQEKVGWFALDAGNNNWRAFWPYFIAACGEIWPETTFSAAQMLETGEPLGDTLTVFLNELAFLPGSGALVLEDFHRIVTPEIHRTLAFLIDHLPRQLRLVILTRAEPSLPLARWRSNGDLYSLPADDLRFSPVNTQKYLGQNLAVILSPEVVKGLQAKTGGWPGGIALAAQGAQALPPDEIEKFLRNINGDYPPLRDFIINEILKPLPENQKDFLLKTSFLTLVSPALAETLTGLSESGLLLEELAPNNFFLAPQNRPAERPADGNGRWFVYRDFLAGALRFQARRQFGETCLRELAGQASRWYAENGWLDEAIEVAFLAQDYERVAELLETITPPTCLTMDIFRVRNWLERLPEKVWQVSPALCFTFANVLLFTSDRASPATRLQVEIPLQLAEKKWLAEENWPNLGAVMAFRSCLIWFQGDYRQSLSSITQALEWLPENEVFWRGVALCNLVPHELYEGRLNNALSVLREAIRLNVVSNNQYCKRAGLAMLAEVYRFRLELDQAIQVYNQIFEEAVQDLSDRSQTLFNLAQICFNRNELATATRYLEQAMAGAREVGDDLLQVKASLLLIRLKNIKGEGAQAEKLLQMLVARTQNWPLLLREVETYQAQFTIARGELKTARHWSVMLSNLPGEGPRTLLEREGLVQARLLITQKSFGAAHTLLDRWLSEAQEQGRAASECENWFLKARVYFGEGNRPLATQALRQALTLAQPENYCQVFLEDGPGGVELLRNLLPGITEPALLAFGRTLLRGRLLPEPPAALRQPSAPLALAPARLMTVIEPLSRQEQRVLGLLSEGLSNSEIADELVVSVNTIKSQVKSIYRKLDINSRREARRFATQTLPA